MWVLELCPFCCVDTDDYARIAFSGQDDADSDSDDTDNDSVSIAGMEEEDMHSYRYRSF